MEADNCLWGVEVSDELSAGEKDTGHDVKVR